MRLLLALAAGLLGYWIFSGREAARRGPPIGRGASRSIPDRGPIPGLTTPSPALPPRTLSPDSDTLPPYPSGDSSVRH
jgi:hypothetical protein